MFTGIGGFEYGIQQALPNAECVGYSEIDKYAIQTYERHFKHKNYGDATKIKPEELPDFDMLCGGFPCQSFSIAGKRRGFQDTRGTLFFDIARIVEVKRPKIILLENVKGLLNHNKGETFRVIIQTLSELGYDVQWMVLNSKFFGVPQNRERVFIIGSIRGTSRPEILPFSRTDEEVNQEGINHPTLTEAIGRQGCSKEYIRSCQTILDINQAQRVYSTEGTSITIKGLGGGQGAKTGLYAIRGRPRYNEKGERELKFYEYDEIPTLSQNCAMGDQKNMIAKTIEISPIYDEEGNRTPEAHRIYDVKGISPCFKNAVAIDVYNKRLREECPTLSDPCHNSIRLFDEKRQGVNLGDIIHFSKLPDLNERLSTEVIGLLRYKSFQDLVDDFPMSAFGYPDDYDKRAFVQECYEVYTPEEEKKFGVLGIRIKLL